MDPGLSALIFTLDIKSVCNYAIMLHIMNIKLVDTNSIKTHISFTSPLALSINLINLITLINANGLLIKILL